MKRTPHDRESGIDDDCISRFTWLDCDAAQNRKVISATKVDQCGGDYPQRVDGDFRCQPSRELSHNLVKVRARLNTIVDPVIHPVLPLLLKEIVESLGRAVSS